MSGKNLQTALLILKNCFQPPSICPPKSSLYKSSLYHYRKDSQRRNISLETVRICNALQCFQLPKGTSRGFLHLCAIRSFFSTSFPYFSCFQIFAHCSFIGLKQREMEDKWARVSWYESQLLIGPYDFCHRLVWLGVECSSLQTQPCHERLRELLITCSVLPDILCLRICTGQSWDFSCWLGKLGGRRERGWSVAVKALQ